MNSLSKLGIGMVGVCLVCSTACRSSSWQTADSVTTLQAERRAKVEKSIGAKQTEVELQLAKDAGAFGDRAACLATVEGILEREPGNVEALLLKAVVHLAKDEYAEADRAIAIALSHEPKSMTAKRLSEISRTKQLAEGGQKPVNPVVDTTPAPLPGGVESRTAYTPTDAGTALVDDLRIDIPGGEPPVDSILNRGETMFAETHREASDEPAFFHAFESLHDQLLAGEDADSQDLPNLTDDEEFVEIEEMASVEVTDDLGEQAQPVPVLAEERPELPGPASMVEEPVLASLPISEQEEERLDLPEPPRRVLVSDSTKPASEPFQPEETAELVSYDAPAGTAEVSDLAGPEGDPRPESGLASALAATDSVSALAAVEAELTNNPNDPQIPIMATVDALEANQPETAASIARLGIAYHPSCAALHRSLGAALYRMGKYASSQVALQQALSLDNSSALSYFLMGCVSEKLGDAEAAESHFRRATELDPTLTKGE